MVKLSVNTSASELKQISGGMPAGGYPQRHCTVGEACVHSSAPGVRDREALWALGGEGEASFCVSESPVGRGTMYNLPFILRRCHKEQVFGGC